LSLGATRQLVFTRKAAGGEDDDDEKKTKKGGSAEHVHTVQLTHGSLFILGPEDNAECEHTVPVSAVKCGPRVSVIVRACRSFKTPSQMAAVRRQHAKTQAKNAVKPARPVAVKKRKAAAPRPAAGAAPRSKRQRA
jgi:hypothetical protein